MQQPAKKRLKLDEDVIDKPLPIIPVPFIHINKEQQTKFYNDIESIIEFLEHENELKETLSSPARKVKSEAEKIIRSILAGDLYDVNECNQNLNTMMEKLSSCPLWMRNMSYIQNAIVAYITASCLIGFFQNGNLKSKTVFPGLKTSEYLLGVIRFAEELETYAIGRAMWKDSKSIILCNNLCKAILQAFLDFNFRNGILRRRFDGLKYRVKKLEGLLFDLSIVTDETNQIVDDSPYILNVEEFKEMANEIDKETEERDIVIKAARDPQKDSKKAIYSLHRQQMDNARKLLDGSLKILLETANKTSLSIDDLHSGAYGNALEEYAEGRIFEEWILNSDSILSFKLLKDESNLTEKEYVGGLVDFTGELGRLGVIKATSRDINGVKQILNTMMMIRDAAIQLNNIQAGNLNKKLDAVFTNFQKMEKILLELILLSGSNRKTLELTDIQENGTDKE